MILEHHKCQKNGSNLEQWTKRHWNLPLVRITDLWDATAEDSSSNSCVGGTVPGMLCGPGSAAITLPVKIVETGNALQSLWSWWLLLLMEICAPSPCRLPFPGTSLPVSVPVLTSPNWWQSPAPDRTGEAGCSAEWVDRENQWLPANCPSSFKSRSHLLRSQAETWMKIQVNTWGDVNKPKTYHLDLVHNVPQHIVEKRPWL